MIWSIEMGYHTNYDLVTNDDEEEKHWDELRKLSDYKYLFEDSCNWYDHKEDMRKYSLKYPNTLFTLNGEGEESGDIWVEYYKNGKMQRVAATITFDSFDEDLLR